MEIILNKDYGGFGLSDKAKALIIKRKGLPFYPYAKINLDDDKNFRKVTEKEIMDDTFRGVSLLDGIVWVSKDFGKYTTDDKVFSKPFLFDYDNKYHLDNDSLRVDKDAIEVIKELGEKADGEFASFRIVSIPDGSYYRIDDYDGIETCFYSASPIKDV